MGLLNRSCSRLYLLDGDRWLSSRHLLLVARRLRQSRRRMTYLIGLGSGQVHDKNGSAVRVSVHFEYVRPDHRRRRSVTHGGRSRRDRLERSGRLTGRLDNRARRAAADRGRRGRQYFGHDDLRSCSVYVEHAPQGLRMIHAHQNNVWVSVFAAQDFA